ncbi:predicted protein [Nematostella vectensis]|uniref:Receptor expression-enhancing protein n=1 Tax=Nematostella vectensis TaxID=45351 RepID=A7RP23_NEMVE|nr:receptor expression-enhancing protein 5 [Nematostella vectensis]EDO46781.1 predicted protein [Nematostella vectensis]|eukprot:XP_001638844.1 predicted protein [Nematostella vectensis]
MEPPCKKVVRKNSEPHREDAFTDTIMEEIDSLLMQQNFFTDLLRKIENFTRVPRRIQVLLMVLFTLLYVAEGYAAACFCNVIAVVFPVYASISAIENPDYEIGTKWLMYWVIFAFVNFMEVFIAWLPSFYLLKFLFLVWCMAPGRVSGSEVMYFRVVRPLVMRHKARVNDVISDAAKRVRQVAERTVDDLVASRAAGKIIGFTHEGVTNETPAIEQPENSIDIDKTD